MSFRPIFENISESRHIAKKGTYSGVRLRQDIYLRGKMLPLFQPSFQRILGKIDTSFESPLESAKILGVVLS